jgi:hypothetical protein
LNALLVELLRLRRVEASLSRFVAVRKHGTMGEMQAAQIAEVSGRDRGGHENAFAATK